MSYEDAKQIVSGKIPPWQKTLDVAQDIFNAPESFARTYTMGLGDMAGKAGTFVANKITGGNAEYSPYEPKTEIGQNVHDVFSLLPVVEGARALSEIPRTLSSSFEIGKVKKIQKAFFPWQKGYKNEYGQTLRKGIRSLLSKGGGKVDSKVADAMISPYEGSEKLVKSQIPKKAKDVIAMIKEKAKSGNLSIDDVIKSEKRLRRSLSSAERTGKVASERSGVIKEVTKNLKEYTKKNIPEMGEANAKYTKFMGNKEFLEKSFEPHKVGMGDIGTSKGTETLRNINNLQPGETSVLSSFGKETGIPIVGPARVASGARKIAGFASKTLPWVIGANYLINKLRGLGGNYSNNNMGN